MSILEHQDSWKKYIYSSSERREEEVCPCFLPLNQAKIRGSVFQRRPSQGQSRWRPLNIGWGRGRREVALSLSLLPEAPLPFKRTKNRTPAAWLALPACRKSDLRKVGRFASMLRLGQWECPPSIYTNVYIQRRDGEVGFGVNFERHFVASHGKSRFYE